ncbi:DarT1-associated NADAR antitoxin family protein [Psychrobacter lutiphocae]|uniref:DarT1-associated NADAR antitoxin family protein n=1 Tax=Psychrobacter lutiphocae TaxID=540500 RepID=UPI0003712BFB|nr:hypothetical protein [Psychrobacter lutiphocae]
MELTPTPKEQKPVFMPRVGSDSLVKTDMVEIEHHVGFATRQKKKTINDLHRVIKKKYGFKNVLELSSKSGNKLSFPLSSDRLKITNEEDGKKYSVENAYQASKVFEKGGPYIDLLTVPPRQAKKDSRLLNSGDITGYDYFGMIWGLEPLTAFYDWLYVNALKQNPQLHEEVLQYQAFTDISFNPKKNIHCPAYSLAMFVALHKRELLDKVEDPGTFYDLVTGFDLSNTEHLLEEGWF